MTEGVFYDAEVPDAAWDEKDPANVSPLVVWLGSGDCDVTGRVFEITGGRLNVCDGWQHGPVVDAGERPFAVDEIGEAVHRSIGGAPDPAPVYGA
jgi:hypothetical protein